MRPQVGENCVKDTKEEEEDLMRGSYYRSIILKYDVLPRPRKAKLDKVQENVHTTLPYELNQYRLKTIYSRNM